MQTKWDSLKETLHNQWLGMVIGFLIVYFIFPLFQYLPQVWVATI